MIKDPIVFIGAHTRFASFASTIAARNTSRTTGGEP
jgi:hypothetical protein